MEEFVLVQCVRSVGLKIVTYVLLALTVVSVLLAFVMPAALPIAALLAIVWYFVRFKTGKEYESSYFDGEVRFAKVINKSRRKALHVFSMENVLQIAPAGDRSVSRYENDSSVKKLNYTSGKKGVPYYEMVVKEERGTIYLISFEPDDKYLDAVCIKSAQKVIRRK